MIEKVFQFTAMPEGKLIERVIDDENVVINHIILLPEDSLPEHYSNSNVYLIITKGELSISLGEQPTKQYPTGNMVHIPVNTKMRPHNRGSGVLEFFIVKAPHPDRG
ncbi:MAG: cupin domain-containing protein [bacterium]|nr:cupin domain-containing protein [bacterium]